jgi:CDP-diacylglycerol--glycerol-3-phosphate 3-phosphatidyltransferase
VLQSSIKAPVTRFITPLCQLLIRLKVSANMVSAAGGIGSSLTAIFCFSYGHFFWGMVLCVFFVLFDLLDGTIARLGSNGGSKWGALLDSTLDRITDSAVIGSVAYYLSKSSDRLVPVLLAALVLGALVSYIKARAEGLGLECSGGLAERTERLIIIFVGIGLAGLKVPYALAACTWLLAIVSLYTVAQRLLIVFKATRTAPATEI